MTVFDIWKKCKDENLSEDEMKAWLIKDGHIVKKSGLVKQEALQKKIDNINKLQQEKEDSEALQERINEFNERPQEKKTEKGAYR